jgi:hypothetical protein
MNVVDHATLRHIVVTAVKYCTGWWRWSGPELGYSLVLLDFWTYPIGLYTEHDTKFRRLDLFGVLGRRVWREARTQLGPFEEADLIHWTIHISELQSQRRVTTKDW